MTTPLLDIKNLSVHYPSGNETVAAIKNIHFHLNKGETLGIIGESGSGKSVTLLSLMGLIDVKPGITSGSITLNSKDYQLNLLNNIEKHFSYENNKLNMTHFRKWKREQENHYKNIRGKEISMIFQNPKLAFNPYYSIGSQINEMIRLHTDTKNKEDAKKLAIEWLAKVKMEAPAMRYNNNPYGLSGGMCQRAMIAMALSSQPSILIADEPTTGLDATIQSNIVDLLLSIKNETDISMIVVSHDFNVMHQLADRVIVYFQGRIIEEGLTSHIFDASRKKIHPYTKRLLSANLLGYTDKSQYTESSNSQHTGCDFYHQCTEKNEFESKCKSITPDLIKIDNHHCIRCWRYDNG